MTSSINSQELLNQYASHPKLVALRHLLASKGETEQRIHLRGMHGSSAALVVASLSAEQKHIVCVLNDQESAGYFYHDCVQLFEDDTNVQFFPSAFRRAIKYGHSDPSSEILRTEVTQRLSAAEGALIVTYPDALAELVAAPEEVERQTLRIAVGEKVGNLFVADMLSEQGFEQVDYVYEPGQFALRGSILDIFSYSFEYPYRVDFFGDEVESIRTFDVDTQLSRERVDHLTIIPRFQSAEGAPLTSLLSMLPSDALLAFADYEWCTDRINTVWEDEPIRADEDSFVDIEAMRRLLQQRSAFEEEAKRFGHIYLNNKPPTITASELRFQMHPQPLFHKNFDLVSQSLIEYLSKGYDLFILSDVQKQAQRLATIFEDRGDEIHFTAVNHTLHEGFVDDERQRAYFTDHQIFDRFHKFSLKSDRARSGKLALSLKELHQFSIGDYVVHIDHGVGRFGGLVRVDVGGAMQETIKLYFKNNDILFVNIHSLHKLSKYRGKEAEEAPKLSKLGSGAWDKIKDKTKKKVKDIARDLIVLYAERRNEKGFAFSPDSFMQHELEASFLYEDTPDQLKATQEVKADMERERPMDRLVCGDVGFGKTEVAMRAAFKAVADNKQVAVLVPTTVLAFQHFQTFKKRLQDFPCRIEYISRARTAAQTREVLKDLAKGEVSIIIGTHRIVSKDVKFHDLGLLIIDEEQKFGVSVKEKLRQMKHNVDTLTMTATPIPRTLQFSLLGARDLSNINTPPPNRYPVQTEVQLFNSEIIREAINFEMSRSGQTFIINNRMQNIHEIEQMVRREVPDARIVVGHGQMEPKQLEKIILDFANYEYDVLIATSIIESGIDVPNANTIIVNNAHHFGLSDLHQLRGRVGRSNRKAFCYLLAPPLSTMQPEARRRLQAIENFAELGSGIHIAMQDLDIRGAGNMLGAEQSGFIADLGYETYQKILEEAVEELRSDEFATLYANDEAHVVTAEDYFVRETQIETDLELMFPPLYVPLDSERIALYRELDQMNNLAAIEPFRARLADRFGAIPRETEELMRVVELRLLARQAGIERLLLKQKKMRMFLVSSQDSPYYKSDAFGALLSFLQANSSRCRLAEKAGRRSVTIDGVSTVGEACSILQEVAKKP